VTETDPWMDPETAGAAFGINPARLRKLAQRGEFPHHKDGKLLRFTWKNFRDYQEDTYVPAVDMRPVKSRRRSA